MIEFVLASTTTVLIMIVALVIDAAVGDPKVFYRRVPHPVAVIGRIIGWFDSKLNRQSLSKNRRRGYGVVVVVALVTCTGAVGYLIVAVAVILPAPELLIGICSATLIAQNSLYRHVLSVAREMAGRDIDAGRRAVALIVGRETSELDEHGVARASIESLAENFSDGVVAPVFWAVLFGLPGLLIYKAVNTADSMIGYRNERYADFGWCAAKLDDVLNWVPARLSALAILSASLAFNPAHFGQSLRSILSTASRHRSPNAGYPEAAMAGALGVRLGGPRIYHGHSVDDAWMGLGHPDAGVRDIQRALKIFLGSCLILAAFLALIFWWGA